MSQKPASLCMACKQYASHDLYVKQKLAHFSRRLDALNALNASTLRCIAVPGWEVNLTLSADSGNITLNATYRGSALKQTHKHKADSVVKLIQHVVQLHQPMLLPELRQLQDRRSSFFVSINDFQAEDRGSPLPLLERCTTVSSTAGVPIPDYTFNDYQEARSSNSDGRWQALLSILLNFAASNNVTQRQPKLTWRGSANQPHFIWTLPLEHRHRRTHAVAQLMQHRGRLERAGIKVDVQGGHLNWSQQCTSRYLLHLDGYSYSASLKYKLACGAVILRVTGGNLLHRGGRRFEPPLEWFEAVAPLTNVTIPILANMSDMEAKLLDIHENPSRLKALSTAATNYAQMHLSPDAVMCYLAVVLRTNIRLFGRWKRMCGRSDT